METSEVCSPKPDTHFIPKCHAHCFHFLLWKGVHERRKKETAAKTQSQRDENFKEQHVYGDSRPNLWEDHDPEEGDTQTFQ